MLPINIYGAESKTSLSLTYDRPGLFDFIKNIPGDIVDYGKETFQKKHWLGITLVVGSTLILIWRDQYLIDKARNLGDHLGISHTNYQKSFAQISVPLTNKDLNIEGPFDSGSALYFIGDGWVDVIIVGGFVGVGLTQSDNRALQTASQIGESVIASGVVVQTLKHITGRESPFTTQVDGGVWRFFPNQERYAGHVPEFDAFPSGHLAAGTAVVTVIGENYPEYRLVRPIGYTLLGVLAFQMMNNGVHWASDYPLAIALGYGFGKIASRKGRKKIGNETTWEFTPYFGHDEKGFALTCHFLTLNKENQ